MTMTKIKTLLTCMAILSSASAMCMEPYTAPDNYGWSFEIDGYIGIPCPLCEIYRLFPSEEFVEKRLMDLTTTERTQLGLSVTNYVGELVPGRLCAFCGLNIPKMMVSEEVSGEQ